MADVHVLEQCMLLYCLSFCYCAPEVDPWLVAIATTVLVMVSTLAIAPTPSGTKNIREHME